jgi:hypothetical protein
MARWGLLDVLGAVLAVGAGLGGAGCTSRSGTIPIPDGGPSVDMGSGDTGLNDAGPGDMGSGFPDVYVPDVGLSPDAACDFATSSATLTRVPADIIWIVDNSGSMMPAIDAIRTGINGFADQLVRSDLDYRMIMLSARTGMYSICVPEPLAGPSCADGARFFQTDVSIRSTQPIEQVIGTLAQSTGYAMGDSRGGAPWLNLLRDGATRTFVMVTDDNQRTCDTTTGCQAGDPPLTVTSLEDFPGGGNPYNTSVLGPGILDPSYMGRFDGYTFDAIYGWGSDTDPTARCTYPGGTQPPSAGPTYTALVTRTGGVRAQICDGAAAFGPFFDAIAASVIRGAPVNCDIDIPAPPPGRTFTPGRVNVIVRSPTSSDYVGHVPMDSMSNCDPTRGGWYYDNGTTPTQIRLCPASCDHARAVVTGGTDSGIDVQFGCASVPI